MKVLAGFILALVLLGIGACAFMYAGLFDVAASSPPDLMDRLAPRAKVRSIHRRAGELSAPLPTDAATIARGLSHYRENCLPCHGAPGVEPAEFHEGMNPEPPEIDSPIVQHYTDAELFWVVKNGIRMTGMPGFGVTHKDDEIRDISAFVRHVPKITADEKAALKTEGGEEHHHHEEEGEAGEEAEHHHEEAAKPGAKPAARLSAPPH